MMKRNLLSAAFALMALAVSADEGMWMLTDLKAQNEAAMMDLGLQIPIEEVYNPDGIALKDAVVDSEHPENNKPAEKGFNNLKFITFDRTGVTGNDNGTKIAAADGLSVVYNGDFGILAADKAATAKLGAGETKTYRLFIWLDEKGEANDVEQGAVFNGTVHVDVVGADQGITGNASSSR